MQPGKTFVEGLSIVRGQQLGPMSGADPASIDAALTARAFHTQMAIGREIMQFTPDWVAP